MNTELASPLAAHMASQSVAHLVLGAPLLVSFCTSLTTIDERFPDLPQMVARKGVGSQGCREDASMVLPEGAAFFSVVVDAVGGLYVRSQECTETIYFLRPEFALLASLIPADSACRVLVFLSRSGELQMGVYDLLRHAGTDLRQKSLFERHAMLHQTFHFNMQMFQEHEAGHGRQGRCCNICVHSVGWHEACVRLLANSACLPFTPAGVCLLYEGEYVRTLTPIATSPDPAR